LLGEQNRAQRERGAVTWETPHILPLETWLWKTANECLFNGIQLLEHTVFPLLLSERQELLLWQSIVHQTQHFANLIQLERTARSIREAWKLLHLWKLPLTADSPSLSEESRAFLSWCEVFVERCSEMNWLDAARLSTALIPVITRGEIDLPKKILLEGFDRDKPHALHDLITALRGCGVEIEEKLPAQSDMIKRGSMYAFDSREDEIYATASWAKELLRSGEKGNITIVFHDLAEIQVKVERIFADVLAPDAVLSTRDRDCGMFDMSLGIPLSKEPLIATALLALSLLHGLIDIRDFGAFLRSPFLHGAETNRSNRARTDAFLRTMLPPKCLPEQIATMMVDGDTMNILHLLLEARKACTENMSPGVWLLRAKSFLRAIGWPGERSFSSREFQAIKRWNQTCIEFAKLDLVQPVMSASIAIRELTSLMQETIFQPEASGAQVQIMGVQEVAGLECAHLWIAGMTADVWPPVAEPNPFIPIQIQRAAGIPGATPERRMQESSILTRRLLNMVDSPLVSYFLRDGDMDFLPSPLFTEFCDEKLPDVLRVDSFRTMVYNTRAQLEPLNDTRAPGLGIREAMEGGTDIFKNQAACPFRAFALHRLHAKALEEPAEALDARDRGKLLHDVLQVFWKGIVTHDELEHLSESQRFDEILHAIDHTLSALQTKGTLILPPRLCEVERERLSRLLSEWITNYELPRIPFEVEQSEKDTERTVGGITFTSRPDRIDRLHNQDRILIDYKTGQKSVSVWEGERPEEPQLLLYAVTMTPPPIALTFANLKKGEMGYKGVAQGENLLPHGGKKTRSIATGLDGFDYPSLLHRWEEILVKIGKEFCAGVAIVDPRDGDNTCQYCSLTPLCRRFELGFSETETDADDD